MSQYVNLLGSEAVERAGHSIALAADNMKQAASQLDDALRRHEQFLDDWLKRLELTLERKDAK
jgi:hypothetical protein